MATVAFLLVYHMSGHVPVVDIFFDKFVVSNEFLSALYDRLRNVYSDKLSDNDIRVVILCKAYARNYELKEIIDEILFTNGYDNARQFIDYLRRFASEKRGILRERDYSDIVDAIRYLEDTYKIVLECEENPEKCM